MSYRLKTEYLRPDSALPRYLMLPRFLLEAELPDGARLLYALLLDRARLSMQNPGWTDERGRVFLIYTIRDLSAAMHRSESAVKVACALSAPHDALTVTRPPCAASSATWNTPDSSQTA